MYCVYKHTNKSNGKCYIGITKKTNPQRRWGKNGYNYKTSNNSRFAKAIVKYGWDNFEHEIIEKNIASLKEANERERYWIKFHDSYHNGYNSTLGGNSNSGLGIPILQIDKNTLKVIARFENITEASEKLNIVKHGIIDCCKRKSITSGDFCWCYEKDYNKNWTKPNKKSRNVSVVCIETGKIYKNAVEAAKDMKIEQSVSGITVCCKHKALTCRGYHWCYYDELKTFKIRETLRKKKVICIETQEIFPSIANAAKKYNVCPSCIREACTGEIRKSCRLHWQFLKDYTGKYKERPRRNNKRKRKNDTYHEDKN